MYEKALMEDNEIQAIEEKLLELASLNKKLNILEWGSGRSTLYFSKFLALHGIDYHWLSIEYNKDWYLEVRKMIKNDLKVEVVLFDVKNNEARQRYTNMKDYINYPKTLNKQFDFILVDGRKRRRCLIEARLLLKPNGVVFLHDAHRKFYHCAFRYYPNSIFNQSRLWEGRKETLTFFQKFKIVIVNIVYIPINKINNFVHWVYLKIFL